MMNRISRLLCWGMALLLPMTLLGADTATALLSAKGAVKVNGRDVPQSSVAYAGDKIDTAQDATVTLTTSHSVTTLAANSAVFYKGDTIEMVRGYVQVKADTGVQALLANLRISPAANGVRFQMRQDDNTIILAALHGQLSVTDGTHTIVLLEGEMMTRSMHRLPPAIVDAPHATPVPALSAGRFPGWAILPIAGAVGGGAAAALVVAGSSNSSNKSPSRP